jgi:Chaperone of endosialidase
VFSPFLSFLHCRAESKTDRIYAYENEYIFSDACFSAHRIRASAAGASSRSAAGRRVSQRQHGRRARRPVEPHHWCAKHGGWFSFTEKRYRWQLQHRDWIRHAAREHCRWKYRHRHLRIVKQYRWQIEYGQWSARPLEQQLGVALSGVRFKEAIKPIDTASEAIFALNPVTFRYKEQFDPKRVSQFGLVAEEVAKVNPALVLSDKEGKPYTVRYDAVNAMLLNEFLKEHGKVEKMEATVTKQEVAAAKQEAKIAQQQKQIEVLTAGLQKVSAQLATASPSLADSN